MHETSEQLTARMAKYKKPIERICAWCGEPLLLTGNYHLDNPRKYHDGYCQSMADRENHAIKSMGINFSRNKWIEKILKSPEERVKDRFWKKVDVRGIDDCWNWKAGSGKGGYGRIRVNGKTISAHRISWILTYGEIENNLWVLHKCKQNRLCCNPNHLYLGTPSDNMRDCVKDGTSSIFYINKNGGFGENSPNHKLSLIQVIEIKEKLGIGYKVLALSKEYGVSEGAIQNIKRGNNWKQV